MLRLSRVCGQSRAQSASSLRAFFTRARSLYPASQLGNVGLSKSLLPSTPSTVVHSTSTAEKTSVMTSPSATLPARPVHLFVDFDDTISQSDTTKVIGQLAVKAAARVGGHTAEAATAAKWAAAAENLKAEYKKFLKESPLAHPPAQTGSLNHTWLMQYFEAAHKFDVRMAGAVSDARVLRDITAEEIRAAAAKIPIRPGALQTIRTARQAGANVELISVSFCDALLSAVMKTVDPLGEPIRVNSNELQTDGSIKFLANSGLDKLRVMKARLAEGTSATDPKPLTVYIGDAASDLLCMLDVDFGIALRCRDGGKALNSTLQHLIDAACIPTYTVEELQLHMAAGSSPAKGIYVAQNWDEISAVLIPAIQQQIPVLAQGLDATVNDIVRVPQTQVPRVLIVAGSDSGGGAGIQADIKACDANGAFSMTAISAITAQNTYGVQSYTSADTSLILAQIESCLGDIGADSIKTGMLPTADVVTAVAMYLLENPQVRPKHLVVDPVMISTSGHSLAESGVPQAILKHLFPLASLVTPNVPEARALLTVAMSMQEDESGSPLPVSLHAEAGALCGREHWSEVDAARAAELLQACGAKAVLVKGGHMESVHATDFLCMGPGLVRKFSAPRIVPEPTNSHGTGCTLASSIAAYLARGFDLAPSVEFSKRYLTRALQQSRPLMIGSGSQKPFDHTAQQLLTESGHRATRIALLKQSTEYLKCYAVTDPYCNEKVGRSMVEAVRQTCEGGATIVQLREKKIDGGEFTRIARECLEVCRSFGVPMVINDRVDVALAVGADGVHIGQDDIPCADVRRMIGPDLILGVSAKTPEQARKAMEDGADYVGTGAVYPTNTKDSPNIKLEGLKAVCDTGYLPVVAIGGITAERAADCIVHGADGVAVVSAIFAAESAADATRQIMAEVERGLALRASRGQRTA